MSERVSARRVRAMGEGARPNGQETIAIEGEVSAAIESGKADGLADRSAPRRRDARGCFIGASPTRTIASAGRKRAPRAKPRKAVAWSARRQARFLAALAETANIAHSARAAGVSETTVYRRRRLSEDFRAQWMAALREGVVKLETLLLDRALNGVERPVWHGGKQVGTMMEYNDRTALALLAFHRGTVHGAETPPDVPIEELRARLKAKLSEMNRRMGGEG